MNQTNQDERNRQITKELNYLLEHPEALFVYGRFSDERLISMGRYSIREAVVMIGHLSIFLMEQAKKMDHEDKNSPIATLFKEATVRISEGVAVLIETDKKMREIQKRQEAIKQKES